MPSAVQIYQAIEAHLFQVTDQSLDSSDVQGLGRVNIRAQHWVAYEGSSYPASDDRSSSARQRLMRFNHYVRFLELQRDWRDALTIHELLLNRLDGFLPLIEGVLEPLLANSDEIVSAGSRETPEFRYRGQYSILVQKEIAADVDAIVLTPQTIRVGLWRSPTDYVGDQTVSTLDMLLNVIPPLGD